ncbi:conserved hypothetical protein [Altererythrobacter sp. B11]|uniref:hypothetical protein n=1 Tax=Altererythrobacter sp. B11 TaxID=2060312 RepID=UPI000DC70903|nr:hypothetical protein [Altererythrobacter sp. B11]BBC72661.1 conserved hypothetical protein [Altererythrobacter sp. B11]
MEDDRISRALSRIEAAAGRIEAAAQKPAVQADPELEQRYARLRGEAEVVLADLDRLIGSLQP